MYPDRALSIGILTGSVSRLAGGLFNSVRRSALAMHDMGVDITIYAPEDEHTAEDLSAWLPLVPQVFPRKHLHAIAYGVGMKKAVINAGHDVLHLHGIWQYSSVIANHWHGKTGGPVMISPRGMLDPWALNHSAWKKKVVGFLFEYKNLRSAACMHALNISEAASMRAFGQTQPIAIIPNGTDMPDLADVPPRPDWARAGRKTLLFLGRLHEKKGLSTLIDAWAKLNAQDQNVAARWHLAIAGWDDGGYENGLKSQVDALSLRDAVTFTGPVFDTAKASALFHSDAFILPSHSEGLPMSVLEAWSYKLPVFMTQACNIPEGFIHNAAMEITVDADVIKSVLADMLANNAALKTVGENGAALAQQCFTWPSIAQRHINVYTALCDGTDFPECVVAQSTGRKHDARGG